MAGLQASTIGGPRQAACFVKASQPAPRHICRLQAGGVRCSSAADEHVSPTASGSRRELMTRAALGVAAAAVAGAGVGVPEAAALPGFQKELNNPRRKKIPEEDYTEGPEGLKYYDMVVGTGPEAVEGKRVVVHYDCKWKGITFITTRQGMGVTGGTPQGFDVGARGAGGTLKGLDLGVRGMKVGGQRKLLVPPNLAYGDKGVGEIPGGATLEFDVQLLSVKQDAVGYRTKLVEG